MTTIVEAIFWLIESYLELEIYVAKSIVDNVFQIGALRKRSETRSEEKNYF